MVSRSTEVWREIVDALTLAGAPGTAVGDKLNIFAHHGQEGKGKEHRARFELAPRMHYNTWGARCKAPATLRVTPRANSPSTNSPSGHQQDHPPDLSVINESFTWACALEKEG